MPKRPAIIAAVCGLLSLAGSVTVLPTAQAAQACRVDYAVTGQWAGGYQGAITLANLGDPLTSWSLSFVFPGAGQSVSQGWGGTWTSSGSTVTVTNAAWNGALATNASVALGFIATSTGANPAPTTFTVNGLTCTGGTSATPTTTPTTPSTTTPTTTTPTTTAPKPTTAAPTPTRTTVPATTAPTPTRTTAPATTPAGSGSNNGLARTPPMGWNSYPGYRLTATETLIKQTADKIVSSGMRSAGYTYVNLDDGWMASARDANGNLKVNSTKFPNGMKAVADYVHSKGLKLGIYEDAGLKTCGGLPGSLGHETADAKLFASWGVDYLKYDNCYAGPGCATSTCGSTKVAAQTRYAAMRDAIVASGRNILLSICNWGQDDVPNWGASMGNMWRTTTDMNHTYARMLSIYRINVKLASHAGPGGWNDPDMLETGNGMTATEDRTMFSLWSQMAAPLISGSKLTTASTATLSILLNNDVIAVDQDSLGKQGVQVASSGGLDVLAKPLANGDVSVVLFNSTDTTATISTTLAAIGKSGTTTRTLLDLWSGTRSTTSSAIRAGVPAHGVVMYRVSG